MTASTRCHCRGEAPPGVDCVHQFEFGDDDTPENCLYRLLGHAMGTKDSECVNRLCTRADDVLYVSTDTDSLSDIVTPRTFNVVTRVIPPNSLRLTRWLTTTWAIWCNGNTPKITVE